MKETNRPKSEIINKEFNLKSRRAADGRIYCNIRHRFWITKKTKHIYPDYCHFVAMFKLTNTETGAVRYCCKYHADMYRKHPQYKLEDLFKDF